MSPNTLPEHGAASSAVSLLPIAEDECKVAVGATGTRIVLPSAEPAKTIYNTGWYAARRRARRLISEERGAFLAVFNALDSAWPHVRALQHLRDVEAEAASGLYRLLLEFIDSDVCEVFRDVALDCVTLVPKDTSPRAACRDVDSINGEAWRAGRYFSVLHLAAEARTLPPGPAAFVHGRAAHLLGWYERFLPLFTRLANLVEGRPTR